ncbi:two-component response regulator ORR41-like [Panicum virgatum]|nr:two-component response regulator ORR41-like [Panicum virgatum]
MAGAASAAAVQRRVVRVLLVEDEEIHRVLARALLKSAVGGGGVELDEAGNGAEAVRRVREGGAGAYDLIITDKQMPVMDGHEATLQIRGLGVTTPIVGLSSDCRPPDVDAFLEAGADDFTPKPLSKEKLNRILVKFNLA